MIEQQSDESYAFVVLMGFVLWTVCQYCYDTILVIVVQSSLAPLGFSSQASLAASFFCFFSQPLFWLLLECLSTIIHRVLSMLRNYMLPEMNSANDHSAALLKVVLYPPVNPAFTITGYDCAWSEEIIKQSNSIGEISSISLSS